MCGQCAMPQYVLPFYHSIFGKKYVLVAGTQEGFIAGAAQGDEYIY